MSFLVCSRPLGAFDVVPVHSVITVESGPCRACDLAVHIRPSCGILDEPHSAEG